MRDALSIVIGGLTVIFALIGVVTVAGLIVEAM